MMKSPEQLALEFEVLSVGMTISQARDHILNSQSYQLETPAQYIMGQLAQIQDHYSCNQHSSARHVMNRLKMAIAENFNIEKTTENEMTL